MREYCVVGVPIPSGGVGPRSVRFRKSGITITNQSIPETIQVISQSCILASTETRPDEFRRPRIMSSVLYESKIVGAAAVDQTRGSLAGMFPELEHVDDEETDESIREARKHNIPL